MYQLQVTYQGQKTFAEIECRSTDSHVARRAFNEAWREVNRVHAKVQWVKLPKGWKGGVYQPVEA